MSGYDPSIAPRDDAPGDAAARTMKAAAAAEAARARA